MLERQTATLPCLPRSFEDGEEERRQQADDGDDEARVESEIILAIIRSSSKFLIDGVKMDRIYFWKHRLPSACRR